VCSNEDVYTRVGDDAVKNDLLRNGDMECLDLNGCISSECFFFLLCLTFTSLGHNDKKFHHLIENDEIAYACVWWT
jgi:hypothetical protein